MYGSIHTDSHGRNLPDAPGWSTHTGPYRSNFTDLRQDSDRREVARPGPQHRWGSEFSPWIGKPAWVMALRVDCRVKPQPLKGFILLISMPPSKTILNKRNSDIGVEAETYLSYVLSNKFLISHLIHFNPYINIFHKTAFHLQYPAFSRPGPKWSLPAIFDILGSNGALSAITPSSFFIFSIWLASYPSIIARSLSRTVLIICSWDMRFPFSTSFPKGK